VMDIALDHARAGERWVLRHRLADGRATDVVGWLVEVGREVVTLSVESGRSVVVDRPEIIAAKRVPAAPGGPDPRRTSAEELERAAMPGWVALGEPLGEWTLRAGGGFTGRANSALAVGDPGVALTDAADRVIEYSRVHGIRPWAQVIVGSDIETGLVALGWHAAYVTTDVLVCRLSTLLGDDLPDPRVIIADELDEAWWAAYGRSRPDEANPATRTDVDPTLLRMILDGHPPRAFAAVPGPCDGAGLAGIARGHVSAGWLGVASVWVDPDHRRRGLGTAMIKAIGHWAARSGARNAYLQVEQQNARARDAYGRLGFVVHHNYRYLTAPTD
jgi:GNAT superfamily N-acetyltransferase